jgi:hypothetical protein
MLSATRSTAAVQWCCDRGYDENEPPDRNAGAQGRFQRFTRTICWTLMDVGHRHPPTDQSCCVIVHGGEERLLRVSVHRQPK